MFSLKKWNHFLLEQSDNSLREFELEFILWYHTENEITVTDVDKIIRSIPNVTTTSKESLSKDEDLIKYFYKIKVLLQKKENIDIFLEKILKRKLQTLPNIKIGNFRKVEIFDR